MTITKTADVEGTLPADLRAGRRRAPTSCAAPATRSRRPRAWPTSSPARRCRSSPTSTTSTRWPSPRSRPACTACGSTRATSASPSTSRWWRRRPRTAAIPIRIGVNGGSLDPDALREARRAGHARGDGRVGPAGARPTSHEVGFDDVKISVKASNVPLMIEAYRQLADAVDHPLHLGRHRGRARRPPGSSRPPPASPRCWPRASATPSATRSPPIPSRRRGPAASCSRRWACASARASTSSPARPAAGPRSTSSGSPTEAQAALRDREIPLQVAVMGCVVNGPGEARDADLGIAAGRERGHLFVRGRSSRVVPEDEMVERARRGGRAGPRGGRRRRAWPRPTRRRPAEADADRRRCSRSRATTPTPASRRGRADPQAARPADSGAHGNEVEGEPPATLAGRWPRRPHPPGRGLPALVPGRRGQGGAGRQRSGAGTMVIRPYGYAIWERMQAELDARIKACGARQRLLPAVHPRELLHAGGRARRGLQPRAGRGDPRRREGRDQDGVHQRCGAARQSKWPVR